MPKKFPECPFLSVTSVNYPSSWLGRDYYDVFPLDEKRAGFVITDVSGKGLGATLVTRMLQGALYGMKWATDPARVFHHINQLLCDHADLGKYATAFFGIVEESGRLEYINAGHPSPILIRKDGAQEAFTDGSLPIGLVPEAEFTTSTYQRQPNDMLVLYNDGVTEAVDPEEQLYGVGRLRAVLSGKNEMPLDEIQRAVLESLESFVHGVRQEDDVALLLVRFRAVD